MPELPDLSPFADRLSELDALMAEPDFFGDARRAADVAREHQKLTQLLGLGDRFRQCEKQIGENREMMEDPEADAELRELAEVEIPDLEGQLEQDRPSQRWHQSPMQIPGRVLRIARYQM